MDESLREYLLGSTIWFDIKQGGYIGAYLKEGLANPIIFSIAKELKDKFPNIIKDHCIEQIWAYKYDSRSKNENSLVSGINIHADFAEITINFWISPDDANLNKDSGGIIIHHVSVPKEWHFNSYNSNVIKMQEELTKAKGKKTIIPYKENRAVLFKSSLLHETDNYEFKEGYENRRINVTILFGKRIESEPS